MGEARCGFVSDKLAFYAKDYIASELKEFRSPAELAVCLHLLTPYRSRAQCFKKSTHSVAPSVLDKSDVSV